MPDDGHTKFSDLTFAMAVFDSLQANIAVLDQHGVIMSVNARWRDYARANNMKEGTAGVGANYFEVCRAATDDPSACAALDGILEVVKGTRPSFYCEYPCHSPGKKRWFVLRATPLVDYPNFVVVSHEDISARVIAEKTAQSQVKH